MYSRSASVGHRVSLQPVAAFNRVPIRRGMQSTTLKQHRLGPVRVAEPQSAERASEQASSDMVKQLKNTVQPRTLDAGSDEEPEQCVTFVDRDGELVEAMCCDYGWRSGAMRMYSEEDGRIPANFLELGIQNFKKEYRELRRSFRNNQYAEYAESMHLSDNPISRFFGWLGGGVVRVLSATDKGLEKQGLLSELELTEELPSTVTDEQGELISECSEIRMRLKQLTLDNDAVWARERARPQVETVWPIKVVYHVLCWCLDVLFEGRPIARFWMLETVARMPYFSYMSMLHLYESLGWWRAAVHLRQIHAAEMIMESLGGDQLWFDRFIGQHSAIVYYWILIGLFLVSPALAYNFSELIEAHAVDTYGAFLDENEELLKSLPPPLVALQYYRTGDLYYFDKFQTAAKVEPRRPPCRNLYDVFAAICDDEGEHVKTMRACQDDTIVSDLRQQWIASEEGRGGDGIADGNSKGQAL